MRFSQKIVAASSVLLLVTASLLSIQQVSTVRKEVSSLIGGSIKGMAEGVADTVTSEMESKKSLAQSTTDILQLDPENRDYVKNVLETKKLKSSFLAVGFGYDVDGKVVENDDGWEPDSSYDPRKRPWYVDAKRDGKLTVTEPYVDVSTKQMIISIATPVYNQGQFTGAMFYDLKLNGLAEMVNKINLFDAGKLFIITSDGMTVAHPNAENNGKNISTYLPKFDIKEGSQDIDIEGKSFLLSLTYLPSQNWFVGALVDNEKAFATVDSLRNSAIIYTIIGVILSIIILTVLIKFLMRPLNTLNHAIKDVAS